MYQDYQNEMWDGQPIQCRVVNITVADQPQTKYYWARPYVGQQRQALEVQTVNSTFYIDNVGGQGIYKLVGGAHMGKPHRSLLPEPYTAITEVAEADIIYPTPELLRASHQQIEAVSAEFYGPEYVERMAGLKKALEDLRSGKFNFKR